MTAKQKWVELVIDIVSYEIAHTHDGELLSEACDRWIERHPIAARACIVSVGALLIAHLANLIDKDYDLFGTWFWHRRRRKRDSQGSNWRCKTFRNPPRGEIENVETNLKRAGSPNGRGGW